MSLDTAGLQSDLLALFQAPPATALGCGTAWGDALEAYASGVVPASTTVSAAAVTLRSSLAAAFATPAAAALFDAAFAAFAVTVAAGMLPLFTGVPPAAPLGVAALLVLTQPTHAAAAAVFAGLIDTWMRTGSATLVAPPNTVLPWS